MPQDKDELLQALITEYAQMYMKLAVSIGVPYDDVGPNEDEDVSELDYIADHTKYDPLQAVISRESCGQIYEVLDGLKKPWKDVTVMYFIQELTTEEISKRLEITNDVCRSRISRARKYLKEKLQSCIDKDHL